MKFADLCKVGALAALVIATSAHAGEPLITIKADQPGHRLSRFLTGACIEDVNHEIYGGLYSQMIFGESFQEPPRSVPPKGFSAFGGTWTVRDGALLGSAGDGPKLISDLPEFADGEVSVEVFFADRAGGNAGLIARVAKAGTGADNFDGYEISLDPAAQALVLGRHRHNWQLLRNTPCTVPVGEWITLSARLTGRSLEVLVNGRSVIQHDDGERALLAGQVGLRQWQREARYRNFRVLTGGQERRLTFERGAEDNWEISGMWRLVRRGNAEGACALERQQPFVGAQSQRITFTGGKGEFGLENQGLNRWGLHFVGGKVYEGLLWVKAEQPAELWVALESADGSVVRAEKRLRVKAGDWQRLEFALTPRATEPKGRFVIKLKQPGTVSLGYAFLQPGTWGRMSAEGAGSNERGAGSANSRLQAPGSKLQASGSKLQAPGSTLRYLPVRRDVTEALIDQGVTLMRYGGSMVNHAEYRWKNMIGPRDRRPPSRGTWYAQSSNGWGIPDFMDFCEAAGFEYIPDFNMDESPHDMADFIEYAKGPANSEWGRKRAADGHPKPYRLRYLELGNEERVDERYAAKFEALASAIWAKDPEIILVVGDFVYGQPIRDPFNFRGAASGITSLAGQQRILRFAKQHDREVWFDVHVGTDGPAPDNTFAAMFTYRDALAKIADGARHQVVVFEFNAGNHTQRRALGNALAINAIERDGRIPVAVSANCLQPDGQNDNGWDQGLLFLNPSQVWLQPPGWVTRMVAKNYLPVHVPATVEGSSQLDVSAKRSAEGKSLVVQVVNSAAEPVAARLKLEGFQPKKSTALVEELAGPLTARNTAANPRQIVPRITTWPHGFIGGSVVREFPECSFTILRFE